MKPIYECLDYLLNHLHANRFKPEGQRIPFDVEHKVLPDLYLTTHEEFRGLMDMLVEDKYALKLPGFDDFNLEDYKKCIMITPKGVDFKMKNGYKGKIIQDAYERNRLKAIANQTLTLTWVLAAGAAPVALLALADLYWKYKWFRAPDWWGMVILNIVVSALTSYVVWKWLQWKQMKKVIV